MKLGQFNLTYLIRFGIPALIVLVSLILASNLAQFGEHANIMATAITVDLVILTPFLYFLFIRKSAISKFTITPVFILSLLLGFLCIPKENQLALNWILTYLLPVVELIIISTIIYQVFSFRQKLKNNQENHHSFIDNLENTLEQKFPKKVATIMSMEIGMIYYAFFAWKKRPLLENTFSYHKNSGIMALLGVLLMVALIELVAVHLLLHSWSNTAAWIFSGISAYGILQIIGLIKSIPRTPITLLEDKVLFRFGILQKVSIPYSAIDQVVLTTKDLPEADSSYQKILFSDFNMVIHLRTPQTITGLFGIQKECLHLAVSVDDKVNFFSVLKQKVATHEI